MQEPTEKTQGIYPTHKYGLYLRKSKRMGGIPLKQWGLRHFLLHG
jgi:hypothetical protein